MPRKTDSIGYKRMTVYPFGDNILDLRVGRANCEGKCSAIAAQESGNPRDYE